MFFIIKFDADAIELFHKIRIPEGSHLLICFRRGLEAYIATEVAFSLAISSHIIVIILGIIIFLKETKANLF